MNYILQTTLDLYKTNPTYNAKQNDAGSRYILATIAANGVTQSVPETATVSLKVEKADGTRTLTAGTVSEGKILVELTNQTLAVAGTATCELQIIESEPTSLLKTLRFFLNIETEVYSDTVAESTDEFTALTEALAEVNDFKNNKEDKSNKVTSIDSESTDIQYPSAKLTYDQLALKEPNLPVTPLTPAEKFLNGNRSWATPAHNKLTDLNADENYQHITTTQVTKLTNIEENAEVNIIETISIDNVNVAPTDRNINLVLATAENDGIMSSEYAGKLDGIAENANNYTHPASHSPSIITQDVNNRFVTDTEKSTWNGKQDALGFTAVPDTRKVNDKALSSDITLTQDDVGDGTTNKVFTSTEKSKLSGIAENANNYVHPTTAGNKHIPAGGSVNKILKWSADGTASWEEESSGGGGSGKKYCKFVVGTSTSGYTVDDVDYLCDGTDDQVEINDAITALPADGGEIIILDGTYNITAKINLNKNNVTISGNGNSTILKRMYNSGSTEGVITLTSANYCKIKDLQIDGNKATYTSSKNYGIQLASNSNNNTVAGNTCNNNSNNGIYLVSSSTNTITGNTCNDNNYGIRLTSSSNNTITGNTCNNNATIGISLNSSSNNNTITGNTCNNNNAYGIYLVSSSTNTITGNTCNNNATIGIYLVSSSTNTITGNICSNNTYGISLNSSSNNTVTGNTCNDNNDSGIHLTSSSNNTVTGNTCNNNNAYGIYLVSSSTNTITGNTCIRGTGLTTDYTSSQYTIRLNGTTNNYNLIAINNCMGKAVSVDGGTGNSAYGNKWDAGNDLP